MKLDLAKLIGRFRTPFPRDPALAQCLMTRKISFKFRVTQKREGVGLLRRDFPKEESPNSIRCFHFIRVESYSNGAGAIMRRGRDTRALFNMRTKLKGAICKLEDSPHQDPNMLVSDSHIASFQNYEKIHFCCLSYPVYILLCYLWKLVQWGCGEHSYLPSSFPPPFWWEFGV